jgi:N-acetylneuraminic acid mutarotase
MIIFGGFVEGELVNSTFKFNFKTSEWKLVTSLVLPSSRAGHSAIVHQSYMYVFGGKDESNQKLNDLWRLDLNTDEWD